MVEMMALLGILVLALAEPLPLEEPPEPPPPRKKEKPKPPPPPPEVEAAGESETKVVFSARAGAGMLVGNTSFGLKVKQFDDNLLVWVTGESELSWSVDFPLARVELCLSEQPDRHSRWAVSLWAASNLIDPLGSMDDSDWVSAHALDVGRTMFSYTESSIRGRALLAEISGRLRLFSRPLWAGWFALDLLAGYRHEYYNFNAFGADGWHMNPDREPIHFDSSIKAVHYQSHHLLPFVGVSLRSRFFGKLLLDARLNLLGVVSIDSDRHILRNKQMDGQAFGLGAQLNAWPRWELGGGFSLGLDLTLQYLYGGWGTLEQYYFADDPGIPGDQTLEEIPDADFFVTSLHFAALLLVVYSF